ncbi:hypothetical protein RQP53_03575 [Paucibacter sp. APW11]|uniref:Uncharacterized protein n=1 Tax=Roseateles aquae TaxID=3077235 RepID=A0ABU3P747_9BURK|nr:hypothetical protein [Paucibacter sp. APW11]MDT8998353.1 hypothetical protein [Paucibacter sp. APW11]
MNAFDQLIQTMLAALQAAPAICADVAEDDGIEVAEGVPAAVRLSYIGGTAQDPELFGAPRTWLSEIGIECFARDDQAGSQGRPSRAMASQCLQRLAGDSAVQAMVMELEPAAVSTAQQRLATQTGAFRLLLRVKHQTASYSFNPSSP